MTQKEKATQFLKLAASGEVERAYELTSSSFIHHNQYFKGDRESLKSAMAEAHDLSPNKALTVKHIYEEGNTVITHSLVERLQPDALSIAVVHIFRFEKEKIVELWDLGQEIINNSPNKNGPF